MDNLTSADRKRLERLAKEITVLLNNPRTEGKSDTEQVTAATKGGKD